jgi:hypothetical protein
MKYAAEIGLGVMIYIPSFIKTGSTIQMLIGGGGDTYTHRQHGDRVNLLQGFFFFFKIRKVRHGR